jgi:hypothetical protein
MHLNAEQLLWALVLAGHLVLLVILLGRERNTRFPWFTAMIGVSSIHLIADHLLSGKLTTVAFYWQSYSAVLIGSILGFVVLLELTRPVFRGGKSSLTVRPTVWAGWMLGMVLAAGAAVWFWGPWPSKAAFQANTQQLPLLILLLSAMKSELFLALLTVMVGLLLRIYGKRYGFGWRSHTEQIALGLSTYSLGFLAVLATTDIIKRTVHLTSRDQYDHIVQLFARLDNARFALWAVVLIWWCVWLWRDEPATGEPGVGMPVVGAASVDEPVLAESAGAMVPDLPAEGLDLAE